ncbi:MAG: enoyl-CoA hydratase/isomerase family protein [Alphaproteobacteria bacterium]|nr:enoyl-CoA hydratase/isomerase family protein [Alphaproteobacteria bacterium]MBL7096511.1 enoyl-CoA hydratase/isomerase family protein [Alphaproteobacteria bacterium]
MSEAEILFERRGVAAIVTLNRPQALNALTHGMAVALHAQLKDWAADDAVKCVLVEGAGERAFCAGGDIRTLYDSGKAGTPYAVEFYRDEYLLNAYIKHYPKPYIALIRGIVMGGGVGVSVHGSHRIADESTLFAMPETGIGLFPDVGGSFFLPRLPGEIGMYLALTGARLKTADALYAGVATHYVPAKQRETLIEKLCGGESVAVALRELAEDAPEAPMAAHREKIDVAFAAHAVDGVLERLERDGSDWALDAAKQIRGKSPTATRLAFRQLRKGTNLSFDGCMRMEFRMVNRVIAGHDFYEGVRATIIDKDGKPKWKPATLAEVPEADIDHYFLPLGEKELPL